MKKNKKQEKLSEDLQREFAKDQFPECGADTQVNQKEIDCWSFWEWTPRCICTECHLG